jgi:hypothetical protein
MKTADLTGAALDWAVAKCEGVGVSVDQTLRLAEVILDTVQDMTRYTSWVFKPSTNWAQGGPIIDRMSSSDGFRFEERPDTKPLAEFYYDQMYGQYRFSASGDTTLIAAMRCYVASKLGDEVEIPAELLTQGETA